MTATPNEPDHMATAISEKQSTESGLRVEPAPATTIDDLNPGIDKAFAHEIAGSSRFAQIELAALTPT